MQGRCREKGLTIVVFIGADALKRLGRVQLVVGCEQAVLIRWQPKPMASTQLRQLLLVPPLRQPIQHLHQPLVKGEKERVVLNAIII